VYLNNTNAAFAKRAGTLFYQFQSAFAAICRKNHDSKQSVEEEISLSEGFPSGI
jgi:hypothetical protein